MAEAPISRIGAYRYKAANIWILKNFRVILFRVNFEFSGYIELNSIRSKK